MFDINARVGLTSGRPGMAGLTLRSTGVKRLLGEPPTSRMADPTADETAEGGVLLSCKGRQQQHERHKYTRLTDLAAPTTSFQDYCGAWAEECTSCSC